MWWFALAAVAAEEPTAVLEWSPRETVLHIEAPTGEALSTDGPANLQIGVGPDELVWRGAGNRLSHGVTLRAEPGDEVTVVGTITSCRQESGYCYPIDVRWRGLRPETQKGAIRLVAEAPAERKATFRADASAVAADAFARAAREHRVVVLDFGAVWCPPCNLLAAEVLHAEPPPAELGAVVVAAIDVDDPSSWAIKDKYAVGGYPTVVVARADGEELGRLVGYPGREAWLAWLAATAGRAAPRVLDVATATPADAAKIARELAESGRESDAEGWLAKAEDGTDLRVARFLLAPTDADAVWLGEHRVDPLVWLPGLPDPIEPALAATARAAIDAVLPAAAGPEAADLLAVRADLAAPEDRPVHFAAAAAVLRSSLSGEPELDRGHYTFLAELQARAGDLDGALAFLDAQAARWTDEPTFDLAAARLANDAGRFADGASRAERALTRSWGDNLLRVAAQLARAKVGLGDAAAAAAVAQSALERVPAPAVDLDVRTARYRAELEKYLLPR